MKRIDVARLLSAFQNARGKMTGRMDGELKIAGEIDHSNHPLEGLHGSGHLTVRDGKVPSLRLNANPMKLTHYNDLGPAKDDPSSGSDELNYQGVAASRPLPPGRRRTPTVNTGPASVFNSSGEGS